MERKEVGPIEQSIPVSALQGELKNSFKTESLKGCDPTIYVMSVEIEPPFQPYELKTFLKPGSNNVWLTPNEAKTHTENVFHRLWFSTQDKFEWKSFNTLLKELSILKGNASFLLIGNGKRITCQLGVSKDEEMPLRHTISSRFPNVQIDLNQQNHFFQALEQHKILSNKAYIFDFRDFYPLPPYWNSLSEHKGDASPLLPVYSSLNDLEEYEIGFYQIVFKSASNRWRENIINLIESEHEAGIYGSLRQNLFTHSALGSDYYKEARNKISGPFFAVSIRIGAFCRTTDTESVLDSLSLAIAGFQHGNKEFKHLKKSDYSNVFADECLVRMIGSGVVHRCGMLLTSSELACLCHFPTQEVLERNYPVDKAIGFKATEQFLGKGVVIGYNDFAGKETIIRQPEEIRELHTSITGLIGKGKSVLEENMALDDIRNGQGVGIIDPHGDLIERVIRQIPKERVKDVVYFNPCEEGFALCYNPFALDKNDDIGKRVDDLVTSVSSLYSAKDWGSVIESILMPVFYTLLRGKDLTLADARILLSKTEEGYSLRESVLPLIDNKEVEMFWTDQFERMSVSTIQRVLTKLSKFLLQEKVARIFSQKKNKINFREIIDKRKIFLGKLPAGILGSGCSNVLSSTTVSAFDDAGMSRQNIPPSERVPFNLYIDECQRLSVKSLEDSLRELRKYKVRLILAYQQKEQLNEHIKLALGNVGTMIVLDLDWDDAQRVFKDFRAMVDVNDLMGKEPGRGYIKMVNPIASLRTLGPNEIRGEGYAEEIRKYSLEKYYEPIKRIRNEKTAKLSRQNRKRASEEELYDEI